MGGFEFSGMDVGDLVGVYAAAAARHHAAAQHGDIRAATTAFDTLSAAYRELRSRGLDAQRALLPLLGSDDPAVRLAAGVHALEFAPDEGEPALAELAASDQTSIGFDAEMTLEVWRDGELRFP
jgi:hypothetical protein